MTEPLIRLVNIHKHFGDKRVLEGFNLDVYPGETMTIIGGSGSGKSVSIKLILGLMTPDQGHVYFNGQEIDTMSGRELREMRKHIGMLFQGGALFDSLTVRENIAYPLREHFNYDEAHISEVVGNCLEHVGLPGIEHMMPADLSGGMRKRVALARAIATKPEVILYDEPTTGLDPANTRRISLLIRELQEKLNITSIVVTHDMGSAFIVSDRMALLHDRQVEFVGTADEAKHSTNPLVSSFIEGLVGTVVETTQGVRS